MPTSISGVYFIVKLLKKSLSCSNTNRGVTHQTDEKHLNNVSEYSRINLILSFVNPLLLVSFAWYIAMAMALDSSPECAAHNPFN